MGEGGAMAQVLSIIGSLVAQVSLMTAEAAGRLVGAGGTQQRETPLGTTIASEVRELYEREKRKSSTVIRGLQDVPLEQVQAAFDRMCAHLGLGNTTLMGIKRIGHTLFRANIEDSEARLRVLAAAKNLRNTDEFRRVFVQRDLTYKQRQEVVSRRSGRGNPHSGAGVLSTAGGVNTGASTYPNNCPLGEFRGGGRVSELGMHPFISFFCHCDLR